MREELYYMHKVIKRYRFKLDRFHALRHSCEQMLYNNRVPDREVKQIMGHKDASISGLYDKPYFERLIEVTRNITYRDGISRNISRKGNV